MIIENVFPKPVGFFKYDKKLTEKQFTFLTNQEQRANEGNTSSCNTYILKDNILIDLKVFIEKCLFEYVLSTIAPKNTLDFRITQSWVNWTKPGQYHHKHSHPNSVISGCFYVDANKETDKIFFYRDAYRQIQFPPSEWNQYNSESWWFPIGTNDLVFFPSNLTHMVQPIKNDNTRISLAFNVFPFGYIGDEEALTGLHLQ